MLEAIVFDFDGVLVDSEGAHFAAIRDEAAALGVHIDQQLYNDIFIGFDDRDAFRTVLAMQAGGPPDPKALATHRNDASNIREEVAELCRRKQARFERLIAEGIEPLPGVRELLDEIGDRLPIAVASGATRRDIEAIIGPMGWLERFQAIVTADDVDRSKPHPQSYTRAVEQLAAAHDRALDPGRCLAIEDTATGLASALAAGLLTLGVCTTGPAEALDRAHRVEPSLAGATLDELQRWFA